MRIEKEVSAGADWQRNARTGTSTMPNLELDHASDPFLLELVTTSGRAAVVKFKIRLDYVIL